MCRVARSLTIAGICLVLAANAGCAKESPSVVEAKLLHLDSPNRIHGRFFICLKPNIGIVAAKNIAEEIVEQADGQVVEAIGRNRRGFVFLVEASDDKVRELAKDPRIESIEPDMVVWSQ